MGGRGWGRWDPSLRSPTFRPLVVDGEIVVCPFCGMGLQDGVLHTCPEMRADSAAPPQTGRLALLGPVVVIVELALLAFALMYLGAHVLVSLGVGCPGTS